MADSVVRLRIDSKEYDANIKRAGQALSEYMRKVREGGGTMEALDEGVMEAVKALGSLGTKADNTRSGLRELTQTISDLTVEYRQMSDSEKNTEFGTGINAAIQQLTERAGMMRDAMDDVQATVKHSASDTRVFDELAGGANLAISAFQTLQGASKLLGIEMGDNVEVLAKLQAAMSVTNGLTQIQAALQKESAVIQGVMAVQAKAAAAAVALQGSTTKAATVAQAAFNAVAKANPYVLLAGAVAAAGVALYAFSSSAKKAATETEGGANALRGMNKELDATASKADIASKSLQDLIQNVIIKNYVDDAESEFNKLIKTYIEGTDKTTAAWMKYQDALKKYESHKGTMKGSVLWADVLETKQAWLDVQAETDQAFAQMGKYQDRIKTFASSFTKESTPTPKPTSVTPPKEVVSQMKLPEFGAVTLGTTESLKELQAQLAAYKQQLASATNVFDSGEAQRGIEQTQKRIDAQPLALRAGLDVDSVVEVQDNLDSLLDDMRANIKPLEIGVNTAGNGKGVVKTAQATADAWKAAAQAITNAGSAMQNIEDPAAQVAGIVMQAIANIALGFAQASAQDSKLGVWGWIIAVTSGLATMTATIASIKSATKGGFAEGGIVPGNSYSGDNLRTSDYGINSGELVLTRAQTNSIAAQLTDGDGRSQGEVLRTIVSAEQLRLVLRNGAGRRGRVVSEWLNG